MSYISNIKNLLMKGRMFRSKGQGLAGGPALPRMRLGFRHSTGGTISHKAIIDSISNFDKLSITTPRRKASRKGSKKASKKASKGKRIKKVSAKKTKKKSSKNFKSLKFNF